MLDALLFIAAGCVLGTITGLLPGLHSNTVSFIALAFIGGDMNFALMIISMNVVQTFVDFVPNILLGAPDNESFVSVLPGHHFFIQGEGIYAIRIAVAGALLGTIVSIPVGIIFFIFLIRTGEFISKIMVLLLAIALLSIVARERGMERKVCALAVIALSGALGIVALRGFAFGDALFPLISGFFGISGIIYSTWSENVHIAQKDTFRKINGVKLAASSALGTIAAAIIAVVPSMGPSQAAAVAKELGGRISRSGFLAMIGAIGAGSVIFSTVVLFATGKIRSGAAAAVNELGGLGIEQMLIIFAAALASAGFGALVAEAAGIEAAQAIQKFDYRKISAGLLLGMTLVVLLTNGLMGVLLLAISSAIGIFTIASKVNRSACMAFLMVPTIMFYAGL